MDESPSPRRGDDADEEGVRGRACKEAVSSATDRERVMERHPKRSQSKDRQSLLSEAHDKAGTREISSLYETGAFWLWVKLKTREDEGRTVKDDVKMAV
jgi:hypothetical protein